MSQEGQLPATSVGAATPGSNPTGVTTAASNPKFPKLTRQFRVGKQGSTPTSATQRAQLSELKKQTANTETYRQQKLQDSQNNYAAQRAHEQQMLDHAQTSEANTQAYRQQKLQAAQTAQANSNAMEQQRQADATQAERTRLNERQEDLNRGKKIHGDNMKVFSGGPAGIIAGGLIGSFASKLVPNAPTPGQNTSVATTGTTTGAATGTTATGQLQPRHTANMPEVPNYPISTMKPNGDPSHAQQQGTGGLTSEQAAQLGQPDPTSFITVARSEPPPAATGAPAGAGTAQTQG